MAPMVFRAECTRGTDPRSGAALRVCVERRGALGLAARHLPHEDAALFHHLPDAALVTRATGRADLPLHGGRVPAWLADRMTLLGRVMAEAIVHHFGRDELRRRLSQPFWFQSFGPVMGMNRHSSGITTSVISALKRGLTPLEKELGIHVCGGRGRHSRRTPQELTEIGY